MSQTGEEQTPLLINDNVTENQSSPKKSPPARFFSWLASWKIGSWIRLIILLVIIAALIVGIVVFKIQKYIPVALNYIAKLGVWGGVIFVAIYVVATVCFIPGSLLTLGGGFVFKLKWGVFLVWLGATIGATLAFLLGRTALRSWIAEKVQQYPRFRAVDAAVNKRGWVIVLLLRLTPILPFNLLNYALALTDVKFLQYFLPTAFGMIPGTTLYVYFGSLASDIADIAAGHVGPSLTVQIIIWVASGVGIIVTVVVITIFAKREMNKALAEEDKKEKEGAQKQEQEKTPTPSSPTSTSTTP